MSHWNGRSAVPRNSGRRAITAAEDDPESTAKTVEALFRPPYRDYHEQRARTKEGWRWFGWAGDLAGARPKRQPIQHDDSQRRQGRRSYNSIRLRRVDVP